MKPRFAVSPPFRALIIHHIQMMDMMNYQIDEVETVLERMIDEREDWSRKSEIIKSVPGLSRMCAIGLIADLPELGSYIQFKTNRCAGWRRSVQSR